MSDIQEKKKPIDEALKELKVAHAAKDLSVIDSAMSKLEIGIFKLYALGSPYHMFYEKKYKSLKEKRFRGKYGLYIVIAIVFIILIFANILMGNF